MVHIASRLSRSTALELTCSSALPAVFALLASHRDRNSFDSGSKDGFKRYSAHLTRKTASLRKTLGISGKGKVDDAKFGEDSK